MDPEFKIFREASITSLPIKFQQDLKKIGDVPSGPGAVNGFICFKERSTSSTVYSQTNSAFIIEVTFVSMPRRI